MFQMIFSFNKSGTGTRWCFILRALVDMLWTKSLFSQGTVFSQIVLPAIKTSSFSQEFCSGARNIVRKGVLARIFIYPTEHLNLPGHCKHLPLDSLERQFS